MLITRAVKLEILLQQTEDLELEPKGIKAAQAFIIESKGSL